MIYASKCIRRESNPRPVGRRLLGRAYSVAHPPSSCSVARPPSSYSVALHPQSSEPSTYGETAPRQSV